MAEKVIAIAQKQNQTVKVLHDSQYPMATFVAVGVESLSLAVSTAAQQAENYRLSKISGVIIGA